MSGCFSPLPPLATTALNTEVCVFYFLQRKIVKILRKLLNLPLGFNFRFIVQFLGVSFRADLGFISKGVFWVLVPSWVVALFGVVFTWACRMFAGKFWITSIKFLGSLRVITNTVIPFWDWCALLGRNLAHLGEVFIVLDPYLGVRSLIILE